MIRFRISTQQMKSMNKLVHILKSSIHAESSCGCVCMCSISGQEDVILIHFWCYLSLQLPSSYMDYLEILLNWWEVLWRKGRFEELCWRVNLEQINKGFIVWDLKNELSFIQAVIYQNTRNFLVIYKVKHSLTAFILY